MAGLPALSGADQETVSEVVVRGTGTTATSLTAAGTWTGSGSVNLTVTAVPAVKETPELAQILPRTVLLVAAARAREVLPTTRVRALVAVVMSVSRASVRLLPVRNKAMTE